MYIWLLQLFGVIVRGHVEMSWPYPMHSRLNPMLEENQRHYNMTSPLDSNGTDFPCKGYHLDSSWSPTASLTAGAVYNMTLQGTATHGGGSCQVSLSYDNGTSFHVIKSIVGGCPLQLSYLYKIPVSLPNGNALLAWSWQNRVGNREFYMNCAQVEILGGKGRLEDQVSLPSIWVANLESVTECRTTENVDPVYPSPGADVEYGGELDSSSPPSPGSCDIFMNEGRTSSMEPTETVAGTSLTSDPAATETKAVSRSDLETAVLNSTNIYRQRHLAKPLKWNSTLANFAEQHAKHCVFDHSVS